MECRTSVLDGGLHELVTEQSVKNLMLSEGNDYAESLVPTLEAGVAALALDPEERRQSRVAGFENSTLVAMKLVIAPGAGQAVGEQIAAVGGEVVSVGPEVMVVNVAQGNLGALNDIKEIRSAEQAVRLQPSLIDARGDATELDAALAARPGLDGRDVVVGVIDTGVDWRHPDFINPDGTSRIEHFIHSRFDEVQGRHIHDAFDNDHINRALRGEVAMPLGDPNGHGTHCASIAAGSGAASNNADFRGVATGARIMAVRSDGLFDVHIINGIRRIFELAGARPAVINLSLGGHWGAHDGTSAIENVIARESGPGRIVAVAAGNEGADRIHFGATLGQGETVDILFTIRDSLQRLNVWIPRGDDVSFEVVDFDGVVTVPDGQVQQTPAGAFRADLRQDPINQDINFTLAVASNQIGRRWALRLHGDAILNGDIHAWAFTDDPNLARDIFMTDTTRSHSIGMPATEEKAISVGSYVARDSVLPGGPSQPGVTSGALSSFSSRGPTRIGVQKPDICAPGQFIGAALADGSEMATQDRFAARRFGDDRYISIQGTSMATPFVVGVVALMLQLEAGLTPEEARQRMRVTAQRDADTGSVWNRDFGYGKIDVDALLSYSAPLAF